MDTWYLDHPSEETLARFLAQQAQETELQRVETHILFCSRCLSRLEHLDMMISVTKLAFQPPDESASQTRQPWVSSFLSFHFLFRASAIGSFVLAFALLAWHVVLSTQPVITVLSANRGSELPRVPGNRNLSLILNVPDVSNGPVYLAIFDDLGKFVWQEPAVVLDEHVKVTIPKLERIGLYFVRLYPADLTRSTGDDVDFLREFLFEVQAI
jgi:hypothetical protein